MRAPLMSASQTGNTLQASSIYTAHTDIVEVCGHPYKHFHHFSLKPHLLQDVQWHLLHDSIFGSVGDDHKLMMFVGKLMIYLVSSHVLT